MIQLTAQPMPGLFDVLRTAGPTPTMTSDFALALSGVMGHAPAALAPAAGGPVATADRQADAGGGKALPVDVAPMLPAVATLPFPAALQAPATLPVSAEEVPLLPRLPTAGARPESRSTPALTQPRPTAIEKRAPSPLRSPALVRAKGAKFIGHDPSGHPEVSTRMRGRSRKDQGEDMPLVPLALLPSRLVPDPTAAGTALQAVPLMGTSFDLVPVDDVLPAARLTPVIDPAVAVAAVAGQAPAAPDCDASLAAARGPAGVPENLAAAIPQSTALMPALQRTVLREAQPVSEAAPPAVPAEASPAPTQHERAPAARPPRNGLASIAPFPADSSLPVDAAAAPRAGKPQRTRSSAPISPRTEEPRPARTPQVATPRPIPRTAVSPGNGPRADSPPRFEREGPKPTPAPVPPSTIGTVAGRLAPASVFPDSTAASVPVAQAAVAVAQPLLPLTQQAPAVPEVAPVMPPLALAPHAKPDDLRTSPAPTLLAQSPAPAVEAPSPGPAAAASAPGPAQPTSAREPVALTPQPAAQAFAAAMFAASERPAPRRGDAAAELAAAFPLAGLGGSAPASSLTVQPVVAPQGPPLDTRTDEWIGAMIERIETLRDESAGVRETRIRLAPDALGTLDVAIRQEGDAVTVRIAADTPAARALLAEAAPRLADLAEARGLKLAGTGIEAGGTGGGLAFADRQPSRQPEVPLPTRPRAAANDSDDTAVTDTRIA